MTATKTKPSSCVLSNDNEFTIHPHAPMTVQAIAVPTASVSSDDDLSTGKVRGDL